MFAKTLNVGVTVACSFAGLLLLSDVMPISCSDTNRPGMDACVSVSFSFKLVVVCFSSSESASIALEQTVSC